MYNFRMPTVPKKKERYVYPNKQAPYEKVCFGIRGQFGDIVMQEPGLRKFIEENPETKIVFAVSEPYKDILPLFENYHENIVGFKVWEGYNDWPTEADQKYMEEESFDALFPPDIPLHAQPDWAQRRHITTETALMIGVTSGDTNIQLKMPADVVKEPKTVGLHLFSSKWPGGARSVDVEKQAAIVDHVVAKGYKVYQLSAPDQPRIPNTTFSEGTYFDSCKRMLTTDLLITCDSGMPWIASAYDHPMVGLYSTAYNPLIETTKNWQPENPNAVYLEGTLANDIPLGVVLTEIDKKLKD